MARVNLSEAVRLIKPSKSKLYRDIEAGVITKKIDDQGKPYIDTSELIRVYGQLKDDTPRDSSKRDTLEQFGTPETHPDFIRLQVELEAARDKLTSQSEQIEDLRTQRDKWQQQAERLLLAAPVPTPDQTQATDAAKEGEKTPPERVGLLSGVLARLGL